MIEIKNMNFKYPNTEEFVLKDINFEFLDEKMYAIVGRSGAGKSTLVSILSGLEKPQSGEYIINGNSYTDLEKVRVKYISMIFQSYNLIETYTVIDNIKIAMQLAHVKLDYDVIVDALKLVDLDETYLNRKILTLSGGEQQRIGIARCICCDADIIIADEPTGNLDEETEEIILNLLLKLAHELNKIVIVVTHSQKVANAADLVLGISNGNLNFLKNKDGTNNEENS